jgi:hypothetical protein
MKHHLPNLGNDAATYEAAILDILQKHPQSLSGVSITIHEAGKAGGAYTDREAAARQQKRCRRRQACRSQNRGRLQVPHGARLYARHTRFLAPFKNLGRVARDSASVFSGNPASRGGRGGAGWGTLPLPAIAISVFWGGETSGRAV